MLIPAIYRNAKEGMADDLRSRTYEEEIQEIVS
jgi:hypothetical protein